MMTSSFTRTFLERDVPQFGLRVPAEVLHRFWTMMAHYHGQVWNGAELGRSLSVSAHAVTESRLHNYHTEEIGEPDPRTTVTVLGAVLKIASKLIPRQATETLQAKGIDLNEIIQLSNNPDAQGTLIDSDHL